MNIAAKTKGLRPDAFKVLGVSVDALQISTTLARIEEWVAQRTGCKYIAVTGMHGLIEAQHDPRFRRILDEADLVVPDGMPLVWIGKLKGFPLKQRVYGPDLMLAAMKQTTEHRHFFYGGAPGIPEKLAEALKRQVPGIQVVGTYSPPFRAVTQEENEQIRSIINGSKPDIVWVGLSTPKQERWMYEQRFSLGAPVMIGVGAAFDFHAGAKRQAPIWMREHGLEWLFRLLQEPRRLWRRYLVYGSQFLFWVTLEQLGIRKFD